MYVDLIKMRVVRWVNLLMKLISMFSRSVIYSLVRSGQLFGKLL